MTTQPTARHPRAPSSHQAPRAAAGDGARARSARFPLRWVGGAGFALAAVLAFAAETGGEAGTPSGTDWTIAAHSIAGGGTGRASSACFDLAGTIGQPVGGVSSGGDFTVTAGFWTGVRLDDSILRTSFEDCDS